MKGAVVVLALSLVALPPALREWLRSSSSRASTDRGIEKYDAKKHAEASESFAQAEEIDHGAIARYNLGTSRVAAGDGSRASADFSDALKDDSLAADAYFNRGSAALQSKAWKDAISDFSETLRRNPADADAKRNLEIALRRKQIDDEKRRQEQEKTSGGGGEKPEEKKGAKDEPKPDGEMDADSLLRAVGQQEQEELSTDAEADLDARP